jgi:hypothetical protein
MLTNNNGFGIGSVIVYTILGHLNTWLMSLNKFGTLVRFEVFMVVKIHTAAHKLMTPCSLVDGYR